MSIEFFMNDKRLCEVKASYSEGAAAMGAMGSNHAGGEHVSGMGTCPLGIPIKENDKFYLAANYDFTKHQGSLTEKGDLDEVMGIGVIMVVT